MGRAAHVGAGRAAAAYRRDRHLRRRTEVGSAMHRSGVLVVAGILLAAVSTTLGWLPGFESHPAAPQPVNLPGRVVDVRLPAAPSPEPVLDSLQPASRIDSHALRRRVHAAVASRLLGRHVELSVEQLGQARPLLLIGDRRPVTPASLLKLLTLAAALKALGPEHRFETSVVRGDSRSTVVLVGGGDPLLTAQRPSQVATGVAAGYPQPASLVTLARRTAVRLHAEHVSRVRLQYDASLFRGPAVDPAWPGSYIRGDVVSPVSALWVDEGRVRPRSAARASDPAAAAAARFAGLLRAHGVAVRGTVTSTTARHDAQLLARVESAPLREIVEHIVELSDNDGAEVVLRQVAIATGHRGSFTAGVRAVKKTLTGMGVDVSRAAFTDGSGLARSDAVPIGVLVDVLQLAADPANPEIRPLISSLPVAGFTGSLTSRFTHDAPRGLGVVRAKTGTLTGVHGLAGIVTTRGGSALVFAAVAADLPVRRTLAAQAELDRLVALLAGCGCRRN